MARTGQINYNNFSTGISGDDFVVNNGQIIAGEGVDGLNTGYGLTIGPKANKQILMANKPLCGTTPTSNVAGDALEQVFFGCENGEIYHSIGTDNVPSYTLASGYDVVQIFIFGAYLYAIAFDGSNSYNILQVELNRAIDGTWTGVNENWDTSLFGNGTTSVLISQGLLYIGGGSAILSVNSGLAKTTFNVFTGQIVGLAAHGTRIIVYNNVGIASLWDGVTNVISTNTSLGIRIRRGFSKGGVDILISEDGDTYQSDGYTLAMISRAIKSDRLNDNTQYINKLNFDPGVFGATPGITLRDDLYMATSFENPGVFKYGELTPGRQQSFHKILNKDNAGVDLTAVNSLLYVGILGFVFSLYDTASTYGADYIDIKSEESATTGYAITPVYTGGTTLKKKIRELVITTSRTNGTNNLILSKRINNGVWEEVRTINNANGIIDRLVINDNITATEEFIDIQFKIEMNNPSESNQPPIFHELSLLYEIIE